MIITDNYILKVFNKDGETYIFSYETSDVWTALKEFWHEDYEHIAGNDSWDIDAYAMENGEVIDTYKFHLCTSAFHHFFDNGHITINEFAKCIKRTKDAETLFQETIVLLAADLYRTIYDRDDCGGWGDACADIIHYAKQFEDELNWREDDDREYMAELEKFERKILDELN